MYSSALIKQEVNSSDSCIIFPIKARIGMSSQEEKCYNNICTDGDLELLEMERRTKELLVKKRHTNKISEPSGTNKRWRTRVSDDSIDRITAKTYKELIDKLYNYYYVGSVDIPTFKQAAYEWIDYRENEKIIEHNTAVHYRNEFKKYIEPMPIADRPINEIKKSQIISMFEEIVGDGSTIKKSTLRNIKTVVNGAFRFANNKDEVDCVDAERIDIRDMKRKCVETDNSKEVYSEEEIEALLCYLRAIKPTTYSLAVELLCCIPARIGELRAITWEDVDFENRILHLRHSIVDKHTDSVNRKATDVDYMKAHSPKGKRDIKLSRYAVNILMELKDFNGDKKYVLNSQGKMPITTNNFDEHLKKYCKACGIKYRSSHKIRFYNCSKMYEMNVEEKTIQEMMGHSSLQMTRHYDRRQAKDITEEDADAIFGYKNVKAARNRAFLKAI